MATINTPIMDSNSHEEIRQLLRAHVPEIAAGVVEVKGIACKEGERLLIAVHSADLRTCPVGAVVGLRGERVKAIMRLLNGEKIDILRWSDSLETVIRNVLAPIRIEHLAIDASTKIAKAYARAENLACVAVSSHPKCQLCSELIGWTVQIVEI
jgi:transcription termination/antitermination protein NusA